MDEPRWLTDTERAAWVRFAAVLELLPGALGAQLSADEGLTHFEYFTLAMLSEAPHRTLRMTALANRTNSTLPRLSHVVSRLENEGFVARTACPDDRRAKNATLTEAGWAKVQQAAPAHVENVRSLVFDTLTPAQVESLEGVCRALLLRLDPEGRMVASGE
ncbi:MarR family winged helix-turn-helix transcriptional regulator [Marisediminicola senii]|uniref:MarR family winged helix-turn-helix transcriptional regulator n=1 Tax=Marisediminicola senii TaxID=2711233 RepID=UPI001F17F039|nr:MarR family transcriptional regulator [Marisediminicola senii]